MIFLLLSRSSYRSLFSFYRSLVLIFSSSTRPLLPCSVFSSTCDAFRNLCFCFFKLYISYIRQDFIAIIFPQSLFSNCFNEVLKSLFDVDNVCVAICVSVNFFRFNEVVVVLRAAKEVVEI